MYKPRFFGLYSLAPLSYSYQLMFIRIFYKPYNAVGFGFAENVLAVGFNRAFADKQPFGNLFITVFLLNKTDNFKLPVGKVG